MNILIFFDHAGNERFYLPIQGCQFYQLLEHLLEVWPQVRLERAIPSPNA